MTYLSPSIPMLTSVALGFACVNSNALGAVNEGSIGEVSLLKGKATAKSSLRPLTQLSKSELIYLNDEIETKSRSIVVIDFDDEGTIRLNSNSVIEIQGYDAESGQESQKVELFKGGLRALTGLIGSAEPKNVSFRAKNTVVGIRGTDFEIRICESSADGCDESLLPTAGANNNAFPPPPIYLKNSKTGERTVVNRPLAFNDFDQSAPAQNTSAASTKAFDALSLQSGNRPKSNRPSGSNNPPGRQPSQGQTPPPIGQPVPPKQAAPGRANKAVKRSGKFNGIYFRVFSGAITITTPEWSIDLDMGNACLIDFKRGTTDVPLANPLVECFEKPQSGNNDDKEWWSEPENGAI